MTDLSSAEIQTTFKNNRRASLLTNAVMAVIAALTAALAVWVAVEKSRSKLTDWSVGVFIALLCVMALLFIFAIVWQIFFRRPYRGVMHRFVAERFAESGNLLNAGGEIGFELLLAGDKLTLLRHGCSDYAQFDLTPVKSYATVCNYATQLVKAYLKDFYFLNAASLSADSVTVTDKVRGKAKTLVLLSADKPLKNRANGFFISTGLIEKL